MRGTGNGKLARCLRLGLAALLAAAWAGPGWAQSGGLVLSVPVLSGAEVVEQTQSDFATYPLIVEKVDQRGGIKGNISSTRTVEGELLQTTYSVAKGSAATVVETIAAHLNQQAGYKPLYSCDGAACGPTFTRA